MNIKLLWKSEGFTLTEIMVAVGIIAILSAIAVPAYIHQVNASHANEAKANLTSLDTAMKSFWAEYAANTGDLDLVGWKPTGTLTYVYGWLGPVPVNPGNILGAHGTACYTTLAGSAPTCLAAWWLGFTSGATATSAGAFTGSNSFAAGGAWTAYARANLNNVQNDQWTIDSHDTLTNTLNGL